jgi:hypothetical protein
MPKQPNCAGGAPLCLKMVAVRTGLIETLQRVIVLRLSISAAVALMAKRVGIFSGVY